MVKEDIIKKFQETGLSKEEAKAELTKIINSIHQALAEEDKLMVSRFGSFNVLRKSSRMGRDPKSGISYLIKPQKSISFSPSRQFRDELK